MKRQKYLPILTDEQRETIFARQSLGEDVNTIAAELGVDAGIVKRLIGQAAIAAREKSPVVERYLMQTFQSTQSVQDTLYTAIMDKAVDKKVLGALVSAFTKVVELNLKLAGLYTEEKTTTDNSRNLTVNVIQERVASDELSELVSGAQRFLGSGDEDEASPS